MISKRMLATSVKILANDLPTSAPPSAPPTSPRPSPQSSEMDVWLSQTDQTSNQQQQPSKQWNDQQKVTAESSFINQALVTSVSYGRCWALQGCWYPKDIRKHRGGSSYANIEWRHPAEAGRGEACIFMRMLNNSIVESIDWRWKGTLTTMTYNDYQQCLRSYDRHLIVPLTNDEEISVNGLVGSLTLKNCRRWSIQVIRFNDQQLLYHIDPRSIDWLDKRPMQRPTIFHGAEDSYNFYLRLILTPNRYEQALQYVRDTPAFNPQMPNVNPRDPQQAARRQQLNLEGKLQYDWLGWYQPIRWWFCPYVLQHPYASSNCSDLLCPFNKRVCNRRVCVHINAMNTIWQLIVVWPTCKHPFNPHWSGLWTHFSGRAMLGRKRVQISAHDNAYFERVGAKAASSSNDDLRWTERTWGSTSN